MKSGAYYQGRWAPPRTVDIIEYEPRAILSTAAEARQQPPQATQVQAIEDHRRTLISQQRPQMRLAHGQKQQHSAHESHLATDQNVRTAVQSYPSSPSNDMQQMAAPYMPIANMGTGNAMSPALHRPPYGIGQTPWATANSPLATVSNAPQDTSILRIPTANMYTAGQVAAQVAAQITAQRGQPATFPSAQRHPVPAVLPPRSVFDSRQQQVTSCTTVSTINSTSHMPTLSRQIPPQPSQSTQGRKRRANEPPEGTAQAQKRQATAASNPPLHTGRYRTPDIMQRLSTAMAASNAATEVASPVSNSQAQLTREQQAYKNELFESHRLAEEQRLERQRWLARKEELRKDPSALFRHYHEYIEYFPLGYGEYKSQYHSRLLANQRMPFEPESDLGVAITYAKEHWDVYMEYPKDVTRATEVARKKAQKQEHDARQQWMIKTKSGRAVR
ncbi:hypothetical protein N0V83_009187 [Neocucurbitaria cava]|uniref:Uncharacterized protein n=1 Tax=Neocucurbitaria cava TaxID=798079 RepID=A0A9W9CIU9_9PLEO|nr:hypothetical protein N0V83_009187 [Neocucurbitaria cava]